jgi:O-acetyl-ADP-ribose deacetylase (regulator of RNase III)
MGLTHEEQRVWMIQKLLDEDPYYRNYRIPAGEQEQKDLLRSLMNVREPKPIGQEFLTIQDEYLKKENEAAGITDVNDLKPVKLDDRLFLWQGDITTLKIDAIINPANSALLGCFRAMHNCADNIIHSKAGIELRLCCHRIMTAQGHEEETGKAKITPAYNLPCDYVIHTVGPIVDGRLTKRHEELLASCYRSCLALAEESGVTSIAFCCISTGVFMFPNDRAAKIAVDTVREYLKDHSGIKKVVFNVYKDLDLELYDALLNR